MWLAAPSHAWLELGKDAALDGLATIVVVDVAGEFLPPLTALLEMAPLRGVGEMSYGIYLYHLPLRGILQRAALHAAPPR